MTGTITGSVREDLSKNWLSYFQYNGTRDSPCEARNVILVVVTLIAAATFQAGVSPPGGVWQDYKDGHKAGQAIYAFHRHAFYVFLIANTLAMSSSILIIMSMTYRFPFHFEVAVATVSMIFTYASAIFAVTPEDHVRFRYILLAAAVPFIVRYGIYKYKNHKRKEPVSNMSGQNRIHPEIIGSNGSDLVSS